MWCKSLTLEKYISFRMKWVFSPSFLSVSPFLLSNLVRRECYAYSIGLHTRPERKSWPDVKFCVHAQCVLPRCCAKEGGKETTGKALRLPPYTLLKVPCGSSPVTRVSRSPLPWEKRSAWGGGCIPPIFASVVRLFSTRRLVPINRVPRKIIQPLRKFDF